jgi:hypothetical protein
LSEILQCAGRQRRLPSPAGIQRQWRQICDTNAPTQNPSSPSAHSGSSFGSRGAGEAAATKASASTAATTSASLKIVTLPCVALPATQFPVKCYTPLFAPFPCVPILENLKAPWLPSLILSQSIHRHEPRQYHTSNVPQELIHSQLFAGIAPKSEAFLSRTTIMRNRKLRSTVINMREEA